MKFQSSVSCQCPCIIDGAPSLWCFGCGDSIPTHVFPTGVHTQDPGAREEKKHRLHLVAILTFSSRAHNGLVLTAFWERNLKYPQHLWRLRLATHHVGLIVISDTITVFDLRFISILLCPDLSMPAIWNSLKLFYSFLRDNCMAKKTSIMNRLCFDSWTVNLNCRLALCHPLTGYSMLFTIGY